MIVGSAEEGMRRFRESVLDSMPEEQKNVDVSTLILLIEYAYLQGTVDALETRAEEERIAALWDRFEFQFDFLAVTGKTQ
jgi:hypothetical protein